MPARLIELAVRARRFSFRLALIIDLAYVGFGALGGAALGRAIMPPAPAGQERPPAVCGDDGPRRLP